MRNRLVLSLAVGATAALFGNAPAGAATAPKGLQRLAAEQTQLWENGIAAQTPLSPTTCTRGSAHDDDVVFLPVLTQFGVANNALTVSCTVRRDSDLVLDVGGAILTEDANVCTADPATDPCYKVNGVDTPFRPATLPAIGAQILTDFAPFATATLDGKALPAQRILTSVFPLCIPADAFQYQDSMNLGHPGVLAAAYAGDKVVIDHLRKGRHTIVVTNSAFGSSITYHLTVR